MGYRFTPIPQTDLGECASPYAWLRAARPSLRARVVAGSRLAPSGSAVVFGALCAALSVGCAGPSSAPRPSADGLSHDVRYELDPDARPLDIEWGPDEITGDDGAPGADTDDGWQPDAARDASADAALDAEEDGDGDGDPEDAEPPPRPIPAGDEVALLAWLARGEYTRWPAEPAAHPSAGLHFGAVRAFASPPLAASLAAGTSPHPVGAAAVKELLGADEAVRGWAVAVRTHDAAGGAGWWWFEHLEGITLRHGQAQAACTGCHAAGVDFILTPAAALAR